MEIEVRVQPRAARTEVAGVYQGRVRIRIAASPVDGAANAELLRFLARTFGVARSSVELVSGATGRNKRVRIHGIGAAEAREKLGL